MHYAAPPMAFHQTPPSLGNQLDDDRVLRTYLRRTLPPDLWAKVEPELREVGELVGNDLYRLQIEDRLNEPVLKQWDAWGHRVDEIEISPLWKRAKRLAAELGLVARGYEDHPHARVVQFAFVYLFHASSDVYTCPLAMTDGATRTLLTHKNATLVDRAVPNLLSRDPDRMWTSGQWMTERTGGSDVGLSETVAKNENGQWRLYGTKWFTSATTSEMALTLGRPEGNPAGGRGLALFYVEQRRADGSRNDIFVNRLKDKLGTRKVPTAELTLEGAHATPVLGLDGGIKAISPMLNVTRTWNAVCAISDMRRAVALARDYATRRVAFGAPLGQKALHATTLAGMQAEQEAAFLLTFWGVELLGRIERGDATDADRALCRLATPIIKATTGKQTVPVISEGLEAFGGAGYIEDTGLPRLLRDAQVIPIWEGTTNVLSLDTLKAMGDGEVVGRWRAEVQRLTDVADPELVAIGRAAVHAVEHVLAWLRDEATKGRDEAEAGARGITLTLGRAMALANLVAQAQFALDTDQDGRPKAAAKRFLRHGVDVITTPDLEDDLALAMDRPG
jgi:acyl-CoA dehydrogenase